MTKEEKERRRRIRKASDKFVQWIGSSQSVILHTIFFVIMLSLAFLKVSFDLVMLILTTVVSLEAIYLAIFIHMTINKNRLELEDVSDDIEEIQEDVEEIEKDIDEIQEDVEEIQGETEQDQELINLKSNKIILNKIEDSLAKLVEEVIELKKLNSEESKKNKENLS